MYSFSRLKIGARLAMGYGTMLLMAIIIAGVGLWQLNGIADASHNMAELPVQKERMVSDWAQIISVGIMRTTAIARSADPSLSAYFSKSAAEGSRKSTEIVKRLEPLLTTQEEKDLYAKVASIRKSYISARDEIMKAKAAGQVDEAAAVFEKRFVPAAQDYEKMLGDFIALQRSQMDAEATHIATIKEASVNRIVALTAVVLALGVLFAWRQAIAITRPLRNAVEAASRVAEGDLTQDIRATSTDECGQLLTALGHMNSSLADIVSQVRTGAEAIAHGSSEIAAGNLDLSARTEQQASSLEETASSMEELTGTVRQNADNARQANTLAATASEVASKGGQVVSEVVDTMGAINDSARKIVDIIGVIDGIAFQTNILALNAAVEAARAGEQGRGFAVVASEVRNLAQRSASAAKEIKALIDDSVDKVERGSQLVDQAGATMKDIVASVKRVTDLMGEIASASQEQTSGIDQVNQAISDMDAATQQNAALVEEGAAASTALQDQAAKLADLVSVFKIDQAQMQALPTRAAPKAERKVAPAGARASALAAPARKPKLAVVAGGDDWEEF
ncbi:methyl-accepting chemotaxis protein [Massilia solisilvae]|uniref:Methyl-accepting chemotaxis protein n=1 Tax=Massilia solisilvae TaxID=1811225 RepID=A0ABT2BGC9_9BURK|nr:methyl-accepting chemotaxis protein [Massilia solisilvae]MCS0607571.1 methyl-accepting chemotaxis protein [Massilia solisilvae]